MQVVDADQHNEEDEELKKDIESVSTQMYDEIDLSRLSIDDDSRRIEENLVEPKER
jgi:hypothetical protein